MICDASRVDILKDEALELFRLLTTVGYDMSHALADALQRAVSQQESEIAFAEALKDLRTEQLQDLAKAHQESKAVMEESSDQLCKAANHVLDTIRLASGSASDMKQIVEAIFRSAATGGAELASLRFRDAEANHKVVMALHNVVQEVTNNDVATLRESLSEAASIVVRIFLDWSKTTVNLMQGLARAVVETIYEDAATLQEVICLIAAAYIWLTPTDGARHLEYS
jgi:hypothetical protein